MNHNFNMNGGIICQPNDVPDPVNNATLIMYYAAFTHSDKCMFTGAGKREQMEALFEMAKVAYGSQEDLIAYPRFTTIVDVNTPLQLDEGMTETMMAFVKYGQPIIVASCDMAGTTAPVTLAGMMTLTNAEVLCTIALAEMIRPGIPVMYGSQSAGSNLRNGAITSGSPEGAIAYKYTAQLAKFYGLPCRGGGSLSDAKVVDAQAGYESLLTFMACCQNHMNLIVHAAGILDGYKCISYEKLMLDFQVIDYVRRYLKDIESDGERIPLDLMISKGQNGQYFTEKHTLDYCREEPLATFLSTSGSCQDPKNQLSINIDKAITSSIEKYKVPENDPAILEKMRAILIARGIDVALLDRIEAL
jgi:trimethylamine--corrinoid protein Co-methyltransferase